MNICKKNSLYTYVNTASDMAKYSTIVYVHVHQVDTATEETPAVLSSLCINLCTYAAIANTALLNHRRLVQPMLDQPRLNLSSPGFNSSRYPPAPTHPPYNCRDPIHPVSMGQRSGYTDFFGARAELLSPILGNCRS